MIETLTPGRTWKSPWQPRFWAKVDVRGSDECWPWVGRRNASGYGITVIWGSPPLRAHRVSYELANGPIPDRDEGGRVVVCHRCDNPPCVNPAHLFRGHDADNIADMHAKGRQPINTGSSGRNSLAKLTVEQVREIRRRYRKGVYGQGAYALAREFGVHPNTLHAVVTHRTWKDVGV